MRWRTSGAFDASLLQYKTMLQTGISRVQIRQVYQGLSAAAVVPTQLYHHNLMVAFSRVA
jgi:hypothetical protein